MWILLQELPGAYSEYSAETAYPNCEAIVCQQFKTASTLTMYDALVLLHDPVDGDEEGTRTCNNMGIHYIEIKRSGDQTQFHPTRQSMNEVDLLDDGY
ncbi:hypothetical protein Tco_1144442 [Tanacetum coccineum]